MSLLPSGVASVTQATSAPNTRKQGQQWERGHNGCGSRSESGCAAPPFRSTSGSGLIIGLYVVVLSLTGSALVYRNELDRYLATPHAAFDETARRR